MRPALGCHLRSGHAIQTLIGALGRGHYVGPSGSTITMNTFGVSAPLAKFQEKFGFTVDNICKVARDLLGKNNNVQSSETA